MEKNPGGEGFAATPAAAQPKFDYKPSAEEEELIRLSQEWMDAALFHKDEKRLREIMSPDFTLQIWDASRAPQPLESWLDMGKRQLDNIKFKYTNLNARVFGDIAVVYTSFWWSGTINGKDFTDSGFTADVWVKNNGSWQVLSRRSAGQQQIQSLTAAE
jgi:hypothetical protein